MKPQRRLDHLISCQIAVKAHLARHIGGYSLMISELFTQSLAKILQLPEVGKESPAKLDGGGFSCSIRADKAKALPLPVPQDLRWKCLGACHSSW